MREMLTRRRLLRALVMTGVVPLTSRLSFGGAAKSGLTTSGWATGGTAAMTGKASYPDPFSGGSEPCELVASAIAGPCTTATDLLREDISEGWAGLPLRLALRVVDRACAPVAGATVKIWHTNVEGSYSGETPFNNFCLLDQAHAASDFFRGVQTSDDDGVVYFDSCYPGWYPGRAIHIHFQVKNGSQSYRVSQLFFPEDITEEIFATHTDYTPFGQPDTVFGNDGVFGGIPVAQRDGLILDVAQMSDGAMLASKTLAVVDGTTPPTPTPIPSDPTPTPTDAGPLPCVGDCNGDGEVGIDELVRGVNTALGRSDVATCERFDTDANGSVEVSELVQAVNAALRGCSD